MSAGRPIIFLLAMIITVGLAAQSKVNTNTLTSNEILKHKDISPPEALEVLSRRYVAANEAGDITAQHDLAKAMARASYNANKSKDIPLWQQKVDSLELLINNVPYDRTYEFHKITWAHANKNSSDAINMLNDMKPNMLTSKDTVWMIDWHVKMANAHEVLGDKAETLKYIYEAEKLNEIFKNEVQKALLLMTKGNVYFAEKDQDKALDLYLKAATIYEALNYKGNLAPLYANINNVAYNLKQYDLADEYMDKLGEMQKYIGCDRCYFSTENNKILRLIELGKYYEAIDLAKKTIAYGDSMGLDKSHAVYLMGVAHRGIDKYPKAASLIERAFDLGKEKEHNGKCSFYSHALYQTYYWNDNFAQALKWHEVHTSYKDLVYNEKKAKEIAVYESKLEALEQKRKVDELKAKVEIDKQKKRILWISLLFGGLFAAALLYAQKQRAKSARVKQDALLLQSNLEKEKLEQQLEFKQKELASQILNMTQKNSLLKNVSESIKDIKTTENSHAISRLLRVIQKGLDDSDQWDQFLGTFKSIHSSYLKKLQDVAHNLTANEIKLASLMKMNLSSKEIASMLNISDEGVKKARYRLRKKLGLESEINVQDYLLAL